ncbi:MAG: hypothetical protein ACK443_10555 [Methylococcaceae bacterium]|jgi:hypothetical protein
MSTPSDLALSGLIMRLWRWTDRNFFALGRELRLSYLPPLMVYLAAGISGLTAIVGTFFVKDYLGLSAEFLAALSFWAMLPWTLKLPVGHLVDLIWRFKGGLVFFGAGLVAASLLIMFGLLHDRAVMDAILPAENWFVISTLLAPIGYVLQDVVADAMTVEAVPKISAEGQPLNESEQRLMHSTMQTLGRVAIIAGTLLVALVNVFMFSGVETMAEGEKVAIYEDLYLMALAIPAISCSGVIFALYLQRKLQRSLKTLGYTRSEIVTMTRIQTEPTRPNWLILGGGIAFALASISVGIADFRYGQEIIFVISMAIVLFLMRRLTDEMEPGARSVLVGTALLIFFFRATPTPGPGSSWWMIDELGFDQSFMARLSLIGSVLSLAGLFIFRRYMAEKSIAQVVGLLTIIATVLSMPTIGMYYGLHHWTASLTGGIVDARFIAIIDTALESPLGHIAMVPMLAWIAHSAPSHLKATFFAVMASFTNLSLAFAQLATKYLNEIYHVTRAVKDPSNGHITVAADYSQLGHLLIAVTIIGWVLPFGAIAVVRLLRWRSV